MTSAAIFETDNAPDVEHEFTEGDAVAVIDCMSFVPEYMPAIRAYEQQQNEPLPFNDGLMLNLDQSQPADLTNTVLGARAQNKAASEMDFQRCILEKFGSDSFNKHFRDISLRNLLKIWYHDHQSYPYAKSDKTLPSHSRCKLSLSLS